MLAPAGDDGSELERRRGAGGEPCSHPRHPGAIAAVACADVGGFPCSQQALYCVREIICRVWLPSLASAQPEYVCLQS